MLVCGTSELPAASHQHLPRSRDGIPPVDGSLEEGGDVDYVCTFGAILLFHLRGISPLQGTVVFNQRFSVYFGLFPAARLVVTGTYNFTQLGVNLSIILVVYRTSQLSSGRKL